MKTLLLLLLIITLNANTTEKVKLQLKWKTQFQFAGFIAAKEKGFYKEEGIEVELLEYMATTNTLLDLEEGKTTFAISDSSVILEVAKGKKLVALMAIYQDSPYVIMSLKSSNITTLSDMNNKKLALYDDMNGKAIGAMLKMNNIYITKSPILNKLVQLKNKKVDLAVGYLSNEPYEAKEMGIELNTLSLKDYGFSRYGDILFTLEKTVKERPELVAKMYRASKKGFKYAFEHIDELVDIIYDKYNTQNKSKEAYRYEANALEELLGNSEEFGKLDPAKIDSIGYVYSYSGSIEYNKENLKNFIYKPPVDTKIRLTDEELLYLKNKKSIDMCYYTKLRPYTMMKNGNPVGVSVDYLRKIEKKIDKKFNFIYANSIEEQFTMAYNKKCSAIPLVQTSPQAVAFITPTISAGKDNLVLVTRMDEPYIFNMDILKDKKIGINREYLHLMQYLDKNHPEIKYIKIEGNGLVEVEKGELFGAIGTSIMMNYELTKKFQNSLKVMTEYPNSYIEGSIGVHIDEPILLSILNKAVASMKSVKQEDVFDKWIDVKYKKVIDYTLVWQIIFVSFILISISLLWNRRLNREMKKRKVIEQNLQVTKENLRELNASLEKRVDSEIEKNKKHQLLMMEQVKLAQMGEMIENIAHQWRQPLAQVNSSIIVIDTILKKNNFKQELVNTKLLEIEDLTEYMSNTIDDFQNFFSLEKQKSLFNIKEVIDKAIAIIQGTLSSNFTKVETNIDVSFVSLGYPQELQQVLVVILNNANDILKIKKVENPRIIVTIEESLETYILSILDNGGGIEVDNLEQVFEPYFTTKHKSQGRGIGLYMAKMIIEEGMKGKLTVKNKSDGACFKIDFLKEILDD